MEPESRPTTAARDFVARKVRRGSVWLVCGLVAIGTAAVLAPSVESRMAGLAAAWVAAILTRFVLMKRTIAKGHRLAG